MTSVATQLSFWEEDPQEPEQTVVSGENCDYPNYQLLENTALICQLAMEIVDQDPGSIVDVQANEAYLIRSVTEQMIIGNAGNRIAFVVQIDVFSPLEGGNFPRISSFSVGLFYNNTTVIQIKYPYAEHGPIRPPSNVMEEGNGIKVTFLDGSSKIFSSTQEDYVLLNAIAHGSRRSISEVDHLSDEELSYLTGISLNGFDIKRTILLLALKSILKNSSTTESNFSANWVQEKFD